MEKFQSLADYLGVPDPVNPDAEVVDRGDFFTDVNVELTAESFCRDILHTREYRASLLRRIVLDQLPPALECLLYHYAHGKPIERVEHTGKNGKPIVTEVRRVLVKARTFADVEEFVDAAEAAEAPRIKATTH